MKKILFKLFCLVILTSCNFGDISIDSKSLQLPEHLGEEVLLGIKNNDLEAVVDLAFTLEDISAMQRVLGFSEEMIQKDLARAQKLNPGDKSARRQNVTSAFPQLRRKLVDTIDEESWTDATFQKCHYKVRTTDGGKIQHSKILVHFTVKDNNRYFTIEATKTVAGQWKIIDDMKVIHESNVLAFINGLK